MQAEQAVRLTRIEAIAVRLPMRRPMKMAGVEVHEADNLLVRIEAHGGPVGWGEAASAPTMTGELLEGMAAAVKYLEPMLLNEPHIQLGSIGLQMDRALLGNASAKAAIDMALHDLVGKIQQQPAHALLGPQRRQSVPALWMLGTGNLSADLAEAKQRLADGCVAFKIKVGVGDPLADAARTRALCQAIGPGALICADANQAWCFEQAAAYLQALQGAPLHFLEQPLAGDDLDGMARLAAQSPIPLGCDEGVHSLADLRQHHAKLAAAGCSLKLIKMGGMRAVYQAALLCDTLGLHVNLACKVAESSIASAAVLHLAAAVPALDWGLSLSSQYLAQDLVRQPLLVTAGHASVPQGHGLGVDVDEALVARFRTRLAGA
jgi:o-succinylbenzoate synthase